MGKRIKDLDTRDKKLTSGNAWFMVDDGVNNASKVGYEDMVRQVLTEYDGLQLAGKIQSLQEALDYLLEVAQEPARYS